MPKMINRYTVPRNVSPEMQKCDKEKDKESRLNYFEARYLGTDLGRFTSVDPLLVTDERFIDPQRWNVYAYGKNNPGRYFDPDGRSALTKAIKLAINKGDAAATFADTIQNVSIVANPALSPSTRIIAGLEIASEFLPVSVGDIKDVFKFASKATKRPRAINGAKVDNLSSGEITRIQNAADRIQTNISVVGGRAAVKGGRSSNADFDFVIDANNRIRNKISNSLPGAGNLSDGLRKNQDIFRKIDNPSQPQIIFTPRGQ